MRYSAIAWGSVARDADIRCGAASTDMLVDVGRRRRPWQRERRPDRRDEAIAGARNGLDESRRRAGVAEGFPQRRHVHRENALFDERARPDALEQLRFRDETARMPDEVHEHVVGFRRERSGGSAVRQPSLADVERPVAEGIDLASVHAETVAHFHDKDPADTGELSES